MLFAGAARRLGLANVARVAWYRLLVHKGMHPAQSLRAAASEGPFFRELPSGQMSRGPATGRLNQLPLFGWFNIPLTGNGPPDWHLNAFTGSRVAATDHWWKIPDFLPEVGDIKAIWEVSRFNWVLTFAQKIAEGDVSELGRLNLWLGDWCKRNPPYRGPNWKCGQEASIRILNLAVASRILRQYDDSLPALTDFIKIHLQRIAPTVSYAIGQDNNHGSSEAAALIVGGSWLRRSGDPKGSQWERLGRLLLENRVRRLVEEDGTFSQYSVNYHRLFLDTLSIAETWRRDIQSAPFSDDFYLRAKLASQWLFAMVDRESGDAPNVGHNDGAHLLSTGETGFRDYRPSVQLAMALFANECAFAGDDHVNVAVNLLGVPVPEKQAPRPSSVLFDHGGFAILRTGTWMSLLRYPRFRFRPSQADALHVDVWRKGENLLRDAGTFSYSAPETELVRFSGVLGHNSIEFDDHEQMPRLGRFLFGDWLKTLELDPIKQSSKGVTVAAAYRDRYGATHHRRVTVEPGGSTIEDRISGFEQSAVLRWILAPGEWHMSGTTVTGAAYKLTVSGTMRIARCELRIGEESRYYMQKKTVPVLEVLVEQPGTLVTEIRCRAQ